MTPPFSILFCGTPGAAVPALKALAADPAFKILGVITQPDRATGRKQQLTPSETKIAAEALGLPIAQPERLNAALPELQERFGHPDFLVVVAYGQILSQAALDWPRIMPVNVHFSLLPRWRGASPVEHAILAGDIETGVTVQRMVKALDAGDVLSRRVVTIHPEDNALTLRATLAEVGATLLPETLKGPRTATPQDPDGITTCGILSRGDGHGDPTIETAEQLFRKLRAFTPWPGLTITVDGADLKVIAAGREAEARSVPLPCCNGTVLHLLTVQPAGKKPMPAADWARGRR